MSPVPGFSFFHIRFVITILYHFKAYETAHLKITGYVYAGQPGAGAFSEIYIPYYSI